MSREYLCQPSARARFQQFPCARAGCHAALRGLMQGAEPAERGPLEQSRAEIGQHGQESPGAAWDGAVLVAIRSLPRLGVLQEDVLP